MAPDHRWIWRTSSHYDDPRSSHQPVWGALCSRFRVEVIDRVVCTNSGSLIS